MDIWIALILGIIGIVLFFIFRGKIIEEVLTILGGSVAIAFLVAFVFAYGTFAWGLIFWKFWYWFFLPVFPSFPHITFLQAVGLMFVVDLFKNQTQVSIKKEYKDEKSTTIMGVFNPWIILFIGWLFKILFL
jgi:hypothetical protein